MTSRPKGNRLYPDDETIGDIITDIKAPTEGGNAALKHYKALKHVIDDTYEDKLELHDVDIAALLP